MQRFENLPPAGGERALEKDFSLERLLLEHQAEPISQEGVEDEAGAVWRLRHHEGLPSRIPEGYAFIGGVARNLLLHLLGERTLPPRDVDIVAIQEWEPDLGLRGELSRELMSDDHSHGHGIKEESLSGYFSSRDFTCNEVLATGEYLYASERAIRDLAAKVIRPTPMERDAWYSYLREEEGLKPKLVMKALRLQVEFEHMYGEGNIEDVADWQWEYANVPLFDLALVLNKAQQLGDALASRFYLKLIILGLSQADTAEGVRPGGVSIRDLALSIRYRMEEKGDNPFVFSEATFNEDPEDLADEDLYERYADLANAYVRRRNRDGSEPF